MAIEEFGLAKEEWFTELLGLEHGIPSHDTFGEVYAAIDTDQFSDCFSRWVADLASLTDGEVIAIDGKCLRSSLDKASKKAAIYRQSVLGRNQTTWSWTKSKSMTKRSDGTTIIYSGSSG